MLDMDTFLTALYAIVDDFYKARPKEHRIGPCLLLKVQFQHHFCSPDIPA